MFKQRSVILFITVILGLTYCLYLLSPFAELNNPDTTGDDFFIAILTVLAIPHLVVTALATFLIILSFIFRNPGLVLTNTILYLLAAILFILYAIFLLPVIIFGFIGYRNQRKLSYQQTQNPII
ncbi:MAG: hypothetical protein RQ856_02155 [Candidatus Izemoplasmatales bacterium]|nr:hypothetical protein [Candidatus Izemoplasmatales bacterium]